MLKKSGICLPAIHHIWKGIIEKPSMAKILIRSKQFKKAFLFLFATVILTMIINSTTIVYSANGTSFFTFGDENRSAELSNEAGNRRYQFNTPTTVTYDKDTITSNPATARVYVNSLISHRITVFRYDESVP